ncbi:MAG TPA: hypothetical protein VNH11_10650 [Pirellulales bacterium]|nr:hypothetical protein [Pirellulales bacterium]
MPHIVVDTTEAELIAAAGSTVHVRDPKGRLVGFITPAPPEEEIAAAKARLAEGRKGPTYTTAEVLAHLRSLENQ